MEGLLLIFLSAIGRSREKRSRSQISLSEPPCWHQLCVCPSRPIGTFLGMKQETLTRLPRPEPDPGRLSARPAAAAGDAPRGLQTLGPDTERDGLLYVPVGYQATRPAPLAVM